MKSKRFVKVVMFSERPRIHSSKGLKYTTILDTHVSLNLKYVERIVLEYSPAVNVMK